ncbi:MAG: hypothetical protein ACUVQ5_06865, partial [Candidatus Methanomethylicaceae archaeon]
MPKICTIFIGKPFGEAGWPNWLFNNEKLRDEILAKLKAKFPQAEFVCGEIVVKYRKEEVEKLKELVRASDGLLIFTIGHYGDMGPIDVATSLIELNVPTILANYPSVGDHYFNLLYSRIRGRNFRVIPISSADFSEVERAVGIMCRLAEMKGKKILLYTLYEPKRTIEQIQESLRHVSIEHLKQLGWSFDKFSELLTARMGEFYLDFAGVDQAHQWRRDESRYRKNLLDIFGIEWVKGDPDELIQAYKKVNEDEAEKVADGWISGASKLEIPREAVVAGAKIYLAIKNLMKKHGAEAVNVDCGTLFLSGHLSTLPCFAISTLLSEGIPAGPESDMDSTVSLLLVEYLTGRAGYTSNYSFNLKDNQIAYLHTCQPYKLYGPNGPTQPYKLGAHGTSNKLLGPAPWVEYPIGEILTTIKVSVLERKIAIRTGKIVGSLTDDKLQADWLKDWILAGKTGFEPGVIVETN